MNNVAERIKFFKMVRDIPYYIALRNEQDYCCATKPIMLKILLESLGLKVRRILCEFKWEKLKLPKEINDIPHDEGDTHEYLEIFIPEKEKWVKIDPNWDNRQKFFPVAGWDGLSDTIIAVPVEKVYSLEESLKLIAEEETISPEIRDKYLERNKKFFEALNRWLQSQRTY